MTREQSADLANKKGLKGIVAFTNKLYEDIPYCVYLKKYTNQAEVGGINKRAWLDAHREYEEYFDFVRWLNESNVVNYNVSRFIL